MTSDFDELLRLFNANGVRFELVGRSPRTAADALAGLFARFAMSQTGVRGQAPTHQIAYHQSASIS